MAKKKGSKYDAKTYDAAHRKVTEAHTKAVSQLMDKTTDKIASVAYTAKDTEDKPFTFDSNPRVKAAVDKAVKDLAKGMRLIIETGAKREWLFACQKSDAFVASIMDTSKLPKEQLAKMQDRNLDALKVFQARKVAGMDLSARVWRYAKQYRDQMELSIDVGIGQGKSAAELSRDIRQNLNDPNRLYRRVRDKRGNLHLSKAAAAFNPGMGIYRSSYKNAMRLTRSEINMAYREAEHERWQAMDFVVGFEVHRTNNETKFKCPLCDRLVGKYPKTFKFKGWHPQCMCYVTPIMEDYHSEARSNDRRAQLRAALFGTEYKKYVSKEAITDYPDGFKSWVEENIPKQARWAAVPYFVRDNFVDGSLAKGLIYAPAAQHLTLLEKAAIRHQQRTPEQAEAIQKRWEERQKQHAAIKQAAQDVLNEARSYNEVDYTELEQAVESGDLNKMQAFMQKVKRAIDTIKRKIAKSEHAVHPAMKTTYRTAKDIDDTMNKINSEFEKERWFERGQCVLTPTRKKGVNGFTYMDGRISLSPERLTLCKSAMAKIGQGNASKITIEEADAMATLWHEITHNRNLYGNMPLTQAQRDVMEMMNEFVSRKTLPEFYSKMGCPTMPHPEFMTNRASTAYNRRVVGYDFVISRLGLDVNKVLISAKKNLFTLKYTEQETTATQALMDGGLDKFKGVDGKPIGIARLKKIISYCRNGMSTTTIENYMKEQGIIAK